MLCRRPTAQHCTCGPAGGAADRRLVETSIDNALVIPQLSSPIRFPPAPAHRTRLADQKPLLPLAPLFSTRHFAVPRISGPGSVPCLLLLLLTGAVAAGVRMEGVTDATKTQRKPSHAAGNNNVDPNGTW